MRHLAERGTVFVVPLGVGAHLQRWGVPAAQVHELEWWQEHVLRGVRLVATPSRHYSGRSIGDARATLWASWSVIGARHRFHVTGDTGYGDHFSAIANKFGPFDLSFVKVGAYGPGAPWLDIHMSAEDAVRAHRELRAKRMVPVHWATFNLAFHAWDEPIRRTVAAARSSAAGPVDLITPRVGDIINADQPYVSTAWREAVRRTEVVSTHLKPTRCPMVCSWSVKTQLKLRPSAASFTSSGAGCHDASASGSAAKRCKVRSTLGRPTASAYSMGPPRCCGKP